MPIRSYDGLLAKAPCASDPPALHLFHIRRALPRGRRVDVRASNAWPLAAELRTQDLRSGHARGSICSAVDDVGMPNIPLDRTHRTRVVTASTMRALRSHSRNAAFSLLLSICFAPVDAQAAGDICYELTEAFWRPPKIGLVRECVEYWSSHWLRCVAQPHCCAPGCGAFPDCGFVERVILDDGKLECNIDGDHLVEFWLRGGVFMQADPLEPLLGFIRLGSRPVPPKWQEFILRLGNSSLLEGFRTVNGSDLLQVRLVRHEDAQGPLGWVIAGMSRRGVTLNDIVILRNGVFDHIFNNDPPEIDAVKCNWNGLEEIQRNAIELLVHEFVHVKQYFDLGATSFYANYLPDSGTLEDQANEVEDAMRDRARAGQGQCTNDIPGLGDLFQEQHALSARYWLHVNDRASVLSSAADPDKCDDPLNVAISCWSPLSSGGYLGVGADAKTGTLSARGRVQLRSRARVDGDVVTSNLVEYQLGAFVRGDVWEQTEVTLTDISGYSPQLPARPTGTVWVNFQAGHLEPGNYGKIVANGQFMTLRSGDYFVNELQIEPSAHVQFDTQQGPVRIFIRDSFMHKGTFLGDSDSVFVAYLGTGDIHLEGRFRGTLVAPDALVDIQSLNVASGQVSHAGAVYARAIELHQGAVFAHSPYRYDW